MSAGRANHREAPGAIRATLKKVSPKPSVFGKIGPWQRGRGNEREGERVRDGGGGY